MKRRNKRHDADQSALPGGLAFVLDLDAPPGRTVRRILVPLDCGQTAWLCPPLGPAGERLYLFYAGLFVLAVLHKWCSENGVPRCWEVLSRRRGDAFFQIGATDPRYGQLVQHLYRVRKTQKRGGPKGGYKDIPAELMESLAEFFPVRESQGKLERTRVDARRFDGGRLLRFWASDQVPEPEVDSATGKGIVRFGPTGPPDLGMSLDYLLAVAEGERTRFGPPSWLDLYRVALCQTRLPSPLMEITMGPPIPALASVSEAISPSRVGAAGSPQLVEKSLEEAVAREGKVLLTGRGGSGKTVALRRLVLSSLSPRSARDESLGTFPFLIEPRMLDPENPPATPAELIADCVRWQLRRLPFSELRRWDAGSHEGGGLSKEDLLIQLRTAALEWLESRWPLGTEFLVAVDALNEVPGNMQGAIGLLLSEISRCQAKVVVTCRNWPEAQLSFVAGDHEVRPLRLSEIVRYMDQLLAGKGRSTWQHRIAGDERRVELARTPYWLSLLCQYFHQEPIARAPSSMGLLMRHAIKGLLDRRHLERPPLPDVLEPDLVTFLSRLAFQMVEANATSFEYPKDVESIWPEVASRWDMLRCSTGCGILLLSEFSGPSRSAQGNLAFSHDLIRDYFAALQLLSGDALSDFEALKTLLKSKSWDVPLVLLFGLTDDKATAQRALGVISRYDRAFAARCFAAFTSWDEDEVLEFVRECLDRPGDRPWTTGEVLLGGGQLAEVLACLPVPRLTELFADGIRDSLMRAAIPHSLVRVLMDDAFPLLSELSGDGYSLVDESVLAAIASLTCPEAYRFLAERFLLCCENRSDDNSGAFLVPQLLLFRSPAVPDLDDVAVLLERAQDVEAKCGLAAPIATVLEPVRNQAGEASEWWSHMADCDNGTIAAAARRALLASGEPRLLEQILHRLSQMDLADVGDDELMAAVSHRPLDVQPFLLKFIHQEAAEQPSPVRLDRYEFIKAAMTHAGSEDVADLVELGLHSRAPMSATILEALARETPLLTRRILQREVRGLGPRDRYAMRRASVTLALCGDESVEADLVRMLAHFDRLRWRAKRKGSDPFGLEHLTNQLINARYGWLLFGAVKRIRATSALHALDTMAQEGESEVYLTTARALALHLRQPYLLPTVYGADIVAMDPLVFPVPDAEAARDLARFITVDGNVAAAASLFCRFDDAQLACLFEHLRRHLSEASREGDEKRCSQIQRSIRQLEEAGGRRFLAEM